MELLCLVEILVAHSIAQTMELCLVYGCSFPTSQLTKKKKESKQYYVIGTLYKTKLENKQRNVCQLKALKTQSYKGKYLYQDCE